MVKSVLFEDILDYINPEVAIVKIDAEGHECKILTEYMQKEDKHVFIPYILLEWMSIVVNKVLCPDVDQLIQGLRKSGYTPYETMTRGPVNKLIHIPWDNLLWVHKDAKKIRLSATELSRVVMDDGNGHAYHYF